MMGCVSSLAREVRRTMRRRQENRQAYDLAHDVAGLVQEFWRPLVAFACCGFFVGLVILTIVQWVDEFFTLAAAIRVCAMYVLMRHIRNTRSTVGISMKMLAVSMMSESIRFMAEVGQENPGQCFLPEHAGEWIYAPISVSALVLSALLVFWALGPLCKTQEVTADGFPIFAAVGIALVMPGLLGTFKCAGFWVDYAYSVTVWLDIVAVFAQIWLGSKKGEVDGSVMHFVALLFLSKVLSGMFWTMHVVDAPWEMLTLSHLSFHFSHFFFYIVCSDYIYRYSKMIYASGFSTDMMMV